MDMMVLKGSTRGGFRWLGGASIELEDLYSLDLLENIVIGHSELRHALAVSKCEADVVRGRKFGNSGQMLPQDTQTSAWTFSRYRFLEWLRCLPIIIHVRKK